jgi:hypothetical protein
LADGLLIDRLVNNWLIGLLIGWFKDFVGWCDDGLLNVTDVVVRWGVGIDSRVADSDLSKRNFGEQYVTVQEHEQGRVRLG